MHGQHLHESVEAEPSHRGYVTRVLALRQERYPNHGCLPDWSGCDWSAWWGWYEREPSDIIHFVIENYWSINKEALWVTLLGCSTVSSMLVQLWCAGNKTTSTSRGRKMPNQTPKTSEEWQGLTLSLLDGPRNHETERWEEGSYKQQNSRCVLTKVVEGVATFEFSAGG